MPVLGCSRLRLAAKAAQPGGCHAHYLCCEWWAAKRADLGGVTARPRRQTPQVGTNGVRHLDSLHCAACKFCAPMLAADTTAGADRGSEFECESPPGSSAHTPDAASIIDYSGEGRWRRVALAPGAW